MTGMAVYDGHITQKRAGQGIIDGFRSLTSKLYYAFSVFCKSISYLVDAGLEILIDVHPDFKIAATIPKPSHRLKTLRSMAVIGSGEADADCRELYETSANRYCSRLLYPGIKA